MKSTDKKKILIHLNNIHRTFSTDEVEVNVLRGVDLKIYEGEFLIIFGESGSGKTTLMNIIGGIDQPSSGSIHFDGKDIVALSDYELTQHRRDNIGFVFQLYNLIPSLTAYENVEATTEIADDPMEAFEALQLVGIEKRAQHFPSQLSGGQQQLVSMARAIAKRPKIMLCDEPTGALDQDNSLKILELLQKINQSTGTTIVMITHASALAAMANRTANIVDGVIDHIISNDKPVPVRELQG